MLWKDFWAYVIFLLPIEQKNAKTAVHYVCRVSHNELYTWETKQATALLTCILIFDEQYASIWTMIKLKKFFFSFLKIATKFYSMLSRNVSLKSILLQNFDFVLNILKFAYVLHFHTKQLKYFENDRF